MKRSLLLSFALMTALMTAAFGAPPPQQPQPAASWAVPDAPYRVAVRFVAAPSSPEAGIEINLPEFGQTRPDLADLLLTDRNGTPQPLAKIGRRPGGNILLLAQKLEPKAPYFLYFGGDKVRASAEWTPKVSLLMETRPAPAELKFDSLQDVKTAWEQSPEAPGAAFVPQIYQGGNSFGPSVRFLTHYVGYLSLPKAREITFYTLSSDCSFVRINDQAEFGWPGQHSPSAQPDTVAKKTVPCPEGLVKIEYYAAKGDIPPEGRLEAATVLGWQTPTGFATIPTGAWIHPGTTQVTPVQSADGQWVPVAKASVESFLAYAGQWLYETRFELRPPQATQGWEATWEFEDGVAFSGTEGARVLIGKESQTVKCKLTRNGVTLNEVFLIDVPERLQRASINDPKEVRRYVALINAEANNKLSADAVRTRLAFVCECGTDQEIAHLAEKWPERNQSDGLWLPTRLAAIRASAQADPTQAKQDFLNLLAILTPATRQIYAAEITTMEMDLLVFCQRDPEAFGRLVQLAFLNYSSDLNRTAKVRIGDLHRLLGHDKEAAAQYQSLEVKGLGPGGPVKDSATSLVIGDLLEKGFGKEAQIKLNEWELQRPMVKYDGDFLLLRARTLLHFGRWSEALAELESLQRTQPESPFQIDAQFYLARCLYEKGSKDEARKLWSAFAKDYPKHSLAPRAKECANQP